MSGISGQAGPALPSGRGVACSTLATAANIGALKATLCGGTKACPEVRDGAGAVDEAGATGGGVGAGAVGGAPEEVSGRTVGGTGGAAARRLCTAGNCRGGIGVMGPPPPSGRGSAGAAEAAKEGGAKISSSGSASSSTCGHM